MILELHYDNTNTYIISGDNGVIMFDTGWAGTLSRFYRELGTKGLRLSDIDYLLISHYHPDHMGIAQEIANQGVKLLVMESQREHLHDADKVFEKDRRSAFMPIDDKSVMVLPFAESRAFLQRLGMQGCIIPTPGHSEDSISLIMDGEAAFVGDLYPLYELELHQEPGVQESWELIKSFRPKKVYYGHARTAVLQECEEAADSARSGSIGVAPNGQIAVDRELTRVSDVMQGTVRQSETGWGHSKQETAQKTSGYLAQEAEQKNQEFYHTVKQIMRYIDKGMSIDKIATKLKVDREFVSDVCRMYLTHQNVGVQGILDRIEIKGR
ncbi:MAG: MBL fold metallo-hydrolase [Lachnospiraceae bacterium]|nr:MBL fold metallo-hydrolase [Lachnospiraceae bacterium]